MQQLVLRDVVSGWLSPWAEEMLTESGERAGVTQGEVVCPALELGLWRPLRVLLPVAGCSILSFGGGGPAHP